MLYAVTKLNSVDVRSLCSCIVCGRMSLSSVVWVCLGFLSWRNLVIESGKKLQEHTHTHTHTQQTTMAYGRTLYKNITNVHPRNST
jgi:hypothetical protein